MIEIETFVVRLPWPPLVSLETYSVIGELRDILVRERAPGFHGRLSVRTFDDEARGWASCSEGKGKGGVIRSGRRGSFATEEIKSRLEEPERIETVGPEVEFYLRTLAEVLHAAAGHHQDLWSLTVSAARDRTFAVSSEDAAFAAGDFILTPVTLNAETPERLRSEFEHAALNAISPWNVADSAKN